MNERVNKQAKLENTGFTYKNLYDNINKLVKSNKTRNYVPLQLVRKSIKDE